MKTIYFVRHGQSEANARRITAGGGLDVDLTEHGVTQAARAGKVLKEKKNIDLIVSSPQKRAFHTAQIIAHEIGYNPEKILRSELFSERHLGAMTGKPHDEVQNYFAMGVTPPGGESTEELHKRVAAGFGWLKTLPQENIVLVSHGGPGRMIRSILRDEPHGSIDSLATIDNAEILELRL